MNGDEAPVATAAFEPSSENAISLPEPQAAPPNPEELVAKAIAPVKAEFLRPPPSRSRSDGSGEKNSVSSNVVKEKKSKRQLKRERQQEQKSTTHICSEVAKLGKVDACRYGSKCRFSHDLDAYLAQKPADLEGTCPFNIVKESCPYGLTCRFASTHSERVSLEDENTPKKNFEINSLNKDLQRLLWKNKVRFPKSSAQLKLLGLSGGYGSKTNSDANQEESHPDSVNGSSNVQEHNDNDMPCTSVNELESSSTVCMDKDPLDDESAIDDLRLSKKAKSPTDDKFNSSDINGTCPMEKDYVKLDDQLEEKQNDSVCSVKVDLSLKPHAREKKLIDFRGKLYLAPLTTVGNLPFRRVCRALGADVTCGEMAMCTNLLQGQASEWALLRRHSSEEIFGVQICGSYPDTVARTVELIDRECAVDFIDINMGCPIDIVVNRGAGSSLLTKPMRMKGIIQAASGTVDKPITVKVRTGYFEGRNRIDSLISDIKAWGGAAVTIHGRSRQQRYSKLADWEYINLCASKAPDNLQVLGNGDIFSYHDWNMHISDCSKLSSCMVGRGALIKPWIFTEIKEQRGEKRVASAEPPATEKRTRTVAQVVAFGSVSLCGLSREMEDAVSVRPAFCRLAGGELLHFFAVFDGHGGSHVSAMCRERMHELVAEEIGRAGTKAANEEEWKAAVERAFARMDEVVLAACACGRPGPPSCGCERSGFESDVVGSTAVVAIVSRSRILVANCGDSRAVLSRSGRALPLSDDHKPDRADELERIEAAGGRVIYLNGARVHGILAMSRALGDKYLKPVVISEPEVVVKERTRADECLVIASDGLWDVISNELACDVARRCLEEGALSSGADDVTKAVIENVTDEEEQVSAPRCSLAAALLARLALGRKSADNISVIVVDLKRSFGH